MTLHRDVLGTGHPVIVLHGLFGSGDNWKTQAQHLSATNRVILMDLRNHGRSPHDREMSMVQMSADVLETIQELGIERAGILGHSLGGKVAMECVLRRPAAFSGLLVVDIAPKSYPLRHAEIIAGMRAVTAAGATTRREADAAMAGFVGEERVRAFLLKSFSAASERTPGWRINIDAIEAEYEHLRGGLSTEALASRYMGPTLFVAGELSDYLLPEDGVAIRTLFPGVRMETVKGAGHWLHAEQPTEFLKLLDGFKDAWS